MDVAAKHLCIVGATSHVAKALIAENEEHRFWKLELVARSPERVRVFLAELHASEIAGVYPFGSIPTSTGQLHAIINCVGFGTPEKVRGAGSLLFTETERIDNLILDYLETHPGTQYINFSSGAVYGSAMDRPVVANQGTEIALDPIEVADFYRISKIHQEAKHRSFSHLSIVDVRLFSFFSQFIDRSAGFLMTDIVKALSERVPFVTSRAQIFRDYIAPSDLYRLLDRILEKTGLNCSFDTCSKAPISKSELLERLQREFGLETTYRVEAVNLSPTGTKPYYYSENKVAESALGFRSTQTSWDAIASQLQKMGFERVCS